MRRIAIAVAFAAAAAGVAEARPRHRATHERVVVVRQRSFLDSGVVVPVGTQNVYMQEMTYRALSPLARTSPGVLWKPDNTYIP